jgi:hypothetical protein
MLVSFAASFTVFCHCQTVATAAAAPGASCCKRSCCERKTPQKGDRSCQGMQAVKLNLQDKQAVAAFHLQTLPMVLVERRGVDERILTVRKGFASSAFWSYKYAPPDRHSFYKCFVI